MIPHRFGLHLPASLAEATGLAAHYGSDARPLTGGTVLLPEMSRGAARPAAVIDLTRCGLAGIARRDGLVTIGAATTYRQLEREPGLLGTFARHVTGGAQIRNRGTVGGSAAWANPSSDAPAVLLVLEAVMVLASPAGERRVPAAQFFTGPFRTALQPGELLAAIEIPEPAGTQHGYSKLKFGESSWPIVTAAALIRPDGRLRVAIGGAFPVPVAVEASDSDELVSAVASATYEPWSDVLASGDYRRRVAAVVARRAVETA